MCIRDSYYDGAQDVLRRKRIALDDDGKVKVLDHLPNNRLVNNIYAKMVDQKTNYSFGRPFSFDTENKAYAAALSTVFGSRFQRTMHNIGEGAWIGGKSWVFPYYDQNGELAFQRFPADEVLPFWADADHTILDAAVHVYVVLEYDETEQTKDVVKAVSYTHLWRTACRPLPVTAWPHPLTGWRLPGSPSCSMCTTR